MKIQTMSIVVGTRACNARCPFCVSRMTGHAELPASQDINVRNLHKAVARAKLGGVTTILLTGKGEPTLYPDQLQKFLVAVGDQFPAIELQTNGLEIGRLAAGEKSLLTEEMLKEWWRLGLDTIALSVVSFHTAHNAEVYHKDYPELATTIDYLHQLGFSVRLCVMMQKGYVEGIVEVEEVVNWCRDQQVEQLTIRPIRKPDEPQSGVTAEYIMERGLGDLEVRDIYDALRWGVGHATLLLQLAHGARIYDIDGQNVCVSDCLTLDADPERMRQLIFYADGRIAYDWQYRGAVLLGGRG